MLGNGLPRSLVLDSIDISLKPWGRLHLSHTSEVDGSSAAEAATVEATLRREDTADIVWVGETDLRLLPQRDRRWRLSLQLPPPPAGLHSLLSHGALPWDSSQVAGEAEVSFPAGIPWHAAVPWLLEYAWDTLQDPCPLPHTPPVRSLEPASALPRAIALSPSHGRQSQGRDAFTSTASRGFVASAAGPTDVRRSQALRLVNRLLRGPSDPKFRGRFLRAEAAASAGEDSEASYAKDATAASVWTPENPWWVGRMQWVPDTLQCTIHGAGHRPPLTLHCALQGSAFAVDPPAAAQQWPRPVHGIEVADGSHLRRQERWLKRLVRGCSEAASGDPTKSQEKQAECPGWMIRGAARSNPPPGLFPPEDGRVSQEDYLSLAGSRTASSLRVRLPPPSVSVRWCVQGPLLAGTTVPCLVFVQGEDRARAVAGGVLTLHASLMMLKELDRTDHGTRQVAESVQSIEVTVGAGSTLAVPAKDTSTEPSSPGKRTWRRRVAASDTALSPDCLLAIPPLPADGLLVWRVWLSIPPCGAGSELSVRCVAHASVWDVRRDAFPAASKTIPGEDDMDVQVEDCGEENPGGAKEGASDDAACGGGERVVFGGPIIPSSSSSVACLPDLEWPQGWDHALAAPSLQAGVSDAVDVASCSLEMPLVAEIQSIASSHRVPVGVAFPSASAEEAPVILRQGEWGSAMVTLRSCSRIPIRIECIKWVPAEDSPVAVEAEWDIPDQSGGSVISTPITVSSQIGQAVRHRLLVRVPPSERGQDEPIQYLRAGRLQVYWSSRGRTVSDILPACSGVWRGLGPRIAVVGSSVGWAEATAER